MEKIILTGGGTGGHIYPNIALIPELERQGFLPIYFGGRGGPEERIAKECGLEFFGFETIKLARSLSPKAILNDINIPRVLSKSVKEAERAMRDIEPSAVFSKGGYASLPAVLAASRLSVPVFAHESDLTLGLANKIAKKKGATILKANPLSSFDGYEVGMPLREGLNAWDKTSARRKLSIPADANVLLITGGSSGAAFINSAIIKMLDALTEKYYVVHIVGRGNLRGIRKEGYKEVEYAEDIAPYYAASDIIASRAGATAVFEICASEKRAIFIPLPKGISRGDQLDNAELARRYGAHIVWQDERFCDNFAATLEKVPQYPPTRAISSDANGKIVRIISATIRRGVKCKDKKL